MALKDRLIVYIEIKTANNEQSLPKCQGGHVVVRSKKEFLKTSGILCLKANLNARLIKTD